MQVPTRPVKSAKMTNIRSEMWSHVFPKSLVTSTNKGNTRPDNIFCHNFSSMPCSWFYFVLSVSSRNHFLIGQNYKTQLTAVLVLFVANNRNITKTVVLFLVLHFVWGHLGFWRGIEANHKINILTIRGFMAIIHRLVVGFLFSKCCTFAPKSLASIYLRAFNKDGAFFCFFGVIC